jgi:TRAP-type C4-dicarboxylate transport system permease small subunit
MPNTFIRGAQKLSPIVHSVAMVTNAAGTLVVLALVSIVNFDVVARGAFNQPFMGAVEIVQFSMVLIVFLQLPDVIRVNRLTRSDGFLLFLDLTAPKAALYLRRMIDSISGLFMVLVAFAIWPEFIEMYESDDYFGIPGVFVAPWWPIKLTIFLSACLCATLFVLKIILATAKTPPTKATLGEDV